MPSTQPRPRRYVQPRHVWRLRLIGFRYSHSRGEYVLRLIGERFGPVYRMVHNGRWSQAGCGAEAALELE